MGGKQGEIYVVCDGQRRGVSDGDRLLAVRMRIPGWPVLTEQQSNVEVPRCLVAARGHSAEQYDEQLRHKLLPHLPNPSAPDASADVRGPLGHSPTWPADEVMTESEKEQIRVADGVGDQLAKRGPPGGQRRECRYSGSVVAGVEKVGRLCRGR